MPWFVSSLNPAGGLKHVAWDIAVFSNFYSLMMQESGSPPPSGVWSWGTGSKINMPLAAGVFNVGGQAARQKLQEVNFYTENQNTTFILNTYYGQFYVGSITPVSSLSTLKIRAGVYYNLMEGAAGIAYMGSHLKRNPANVSSGIYLTSCAVPSNIANVGVVAGNTVGQGNRQGLMAFERVDSAGNLDPKQYGIAWALGVTSTGLTITAGYVTIEEWL